MWVSTRWQYYRGHEIASRFYSITAIWGNCKEYLQQHKRPHPCFVLRSHYTAVKHTISHGEEDTLVPVKESRNRSASRANRRIPWIFSQRRAGLIIYD